MFCPHTFRSRLTLQLQSRLAGRLKTLRGPHVACGPRVPHPWSTVYTVTDSQGTSRWSDSPLVRRPIGPTAHWSENPLVRRPIGPKKCHRSENHCSENHWSEKVSLVRKPIGSKKCHWSENSGSKRQVFFK